MDQMTLNVDQISLNDDFQFQGKKQLQGKLSLYGLFYLHLPEKKSNVGTVKYSLYRVSGTSGFCFHSTTHTKSKQKWLYQYYLGGGFK